MPRAYSHGPDVAFAEESYPHDVDLLDRARAAATRTGGAEAGSVGIGLDHCWEALAWGWLTERPTAELQALVRSGAELVRARLDVPRGRPEPLRDVEGLVATALLAGDGESAARAAALQVLPPSQEADWSAVALVALARGDDAAATVAAATMRAIVAAPTTAPMAAAWSEHLDALVDAVVHADQGGFDAALAARARAVARLHRWRLQRRRWSGVLDRTAIALAAVGAQRGLVVPAGIDTVPADLLAEVSTGASAPAGAGGQDGWGTRWRSVRARWTRWSGSSGPRR